MHDERKPFGRARSTLRALRTVTAIGADSVRAVKHSSDPTPGWLKPPERASYPVHPTSGRYAAVTPDADAGDWLATVAAEAPRRVGTHILVDVWLTKESAADGSAVLVAHIGDRRVGIMQEPAAQVFDTVVRAAALLDEDPYPSRVTTSPRVATAGSLCPAVVSSWFTP